MKLPLLHLASQSPRRKQLLEALGLGFRVVLPTASEVHPEVSSVEAITLQNALDKATSIKNELADPTDIALGADTLVVLGPNVLGKPMDATHAAEMLRRLSGRTQMVVTGIALFSPQFGTRKAATKSYVTFRKLTDDEILNYCATREPYDKAGAYAVQGMGALFIESIEGSYTNVMGLPIESLMVELSSLSKIPVHHWFQ